MEQNPTVLTSPLVKAFFSTASNLPIRPQLLALSVGTLDRIVDRDLPGRWNFPYLDALWAGDDAARRGR